MFRTATRLALIATTFSCAPNPLRGAPARETLPNGATLVRYPDLPAIDSVGPEVTDVQIDLRFGSREGDDPNFIFGNIRGIQAASDGTIYVLDYQAVEVRVFSPDGAVPAHHRAAGRRPRRDHGKPTGSSCRATRSCG